MTLLQRGTRTRASLKTLFETQRGMALPLTPNLKRLTACRLDGTVIQPTGKKYHLPMATLGHWNKHGVMEEEYLFWDNATLMQQIGVGK